MPAKRRRKAGRRRVELVKAKQLAGVTSGVTSDQQFGSLCCEVTFLIPRYGYLNVLFAPFCDCI